MSQILGTVVAAIVTTGDTANTFAVVDQAEMRGGHHTVASLTARDAISSDRRTEGMTCWITTTAQLFRLVGGTANTNWVQEFTNNGTSSVSVDQVARNTANSALAGVNQVYPIAVSGTTMANLDAVWIGTLNTIVAGIVASNNDPTARALAYSALVTAWWGTAGVAQAFNLASQGTNGANFATYLASQGTNGVNQVYPIANAGTSGANFAIFLASQGTNGVNQVYPIAVAGTTVANLDAIWIGTLNTAVAGLSGGSVDSSARAGVAQAIFIATEGTSGVNQVYPIAVAGTTVANLDATWIGTINATLSSLTGGTNAAGRSLLLCAGFTPSAAGADVAEVVVPYSPADGTTAWSWSTRRLVVRVQTAGNQSVVAFEKSTTNGAFTATALGTVTLPVSAYEAYATGSSLGTVTSGDKVRFNILSMGTALNWTCIAEISHP